MGTITDRIDSVTKIPPQGCASHELNPSVTAPFLNEAMLSGTIAQLFDSFCMRHSGTNLGTVSSFPSFDSETARARAR